MPVALRRFVTCCQVPAAPCVSGASGTALSVLSLLLCCSSGEQITEQTPVRVFVQICCSPLSPQGPSSAVWSPRLSWPCRVQPQHWDGGGSGISSPTQQQQLQEQQQQQQQCASCRHSHTGCRQIWAREAAAPCLQPLPGEHPWPLISLMTWGKQEHFLPCSSIYKGFG